MRNLIVDNKGIGKSSGVYEESINDSFVSQGQIWVIQGHVELRLRST